MDPIFETAKLFRDQLTQIHQTMDYSSYKTLTLNLEVEVSGDSAKFRVFYQDGYGGIGKVEATDYKEVIEEVKRRLKFDEKAKGAIDASLVALPAPDPVATIRVEIPF